MLTFNLKDDEKRSYVAGSTRMTFSNGWMLDVGRCETNRKLRYDEPTNGLIRTSVEIFKLFRAAFGKQQDILQ